MKSSSSAFKYTNRDVTSEFTIRTGKGYNIPHNFIDGLMNPLGDGKIDFCKSLARCKSAQCANVAYIFCRCGMMYIGHTINTLSQRYKSESDISTGLNELVVKPHNSEYALRSIQCGDLPSVLVEALLCYFADERGFPLTKRCLRF